MRIMIQITKLALLAILQNLIRLDQVDSTFVSTITLSSTTKSKYLARPKWGEVALPTTKANENEISAQCIDSLNVIYESDSILAIEKPENVSHHDDDNPDDDDSNNEMGILSYVRELQKQKEITYQGRLWGVHRLDRVTSGVLLFAKSKYVANELTNLFREKQVIKYYIALSNKKPKKKKQGWIKGDMVQSRRKSWKLCDTLNNPAVTRFFTSGLGGCNLNIDDFITTDCDSTKCDDDFNNTILPKTMILFRPHTGKTHQLRVAAKSLGIPILGDVTYNDANMSKNLKRTYLHAAALHLNLKKEDDGVENVVIYNPPTSWFCSHHGDKEQSNGMEEVFKNIMKKNCESEDILNMMD